MSKVAITDTELRNRADEHGEVGVTDAADRLGISARRVRALVNPECNCVIRRRRAKTEFNRKARRYKKALDNTSVVPDADCPECLGTGRGIGRLSARLDSTGNYMIKVEDLIEFASVERRAGAPRRTKQK